MSPVLPVPPALLPFAKARQPWAMLIQGVYHVDPLTCPQCGGRMKIIALIEAHQHDVLERILRHCVLWKPPPRPPPQPPPAARPAAQRSAANPDVDPDFLEHLHREAQGEQLDLPWD